MKEHIVSLGNTIVPSYLVLKSKGYQISVTSKEGSHEEEWTAENEIVCLHAEDPVTLLGLAAMFENRGKEWKASDKAIDDFEKEFLS